MNTTTQLLQGLLARGWTQSAITRRTGIPQPRLSKWARGKPPSGAEDALKLKALQDSGELPVDSATAGGGVVHAGTVAAADADRAASQTAEEKV